MFQNIKFIQLLTYILWYFCVKPRANNYQILTCNVIISLSWLFWFKKSALKCRSLLLIMKYFCILYKISLACLFVRLRTLYSYPIFPLPIVFIRIINRHMYREYPFRHGSPLKCAANRTVWSKPQTVPILKIHPPVPLLNCLVSFSSFFFLTLRSQNSLPNFNFTHLIGRIIIGHLPTFLQNIILVRSNVNQTKPNRFSLVFGRICETVWRGKGRYRSHMI